MAEVTEINPRRNGICLIAAMAGNTHNSLCQAFLREWFPEKTVYSRFAVTTYILFGKTGTHADHRHF